MKQDHSRTHTPGLTLSVCRMQLKIIQMDATGCYDTENGTEDEEEVAVNDTENGTEDEEEMPVNSSPLFSDTECSDFD